MSVLEKAERLRGVALTYAQGEKERREREQATIALGEVEVALATLARTAETARAAARVGVPLDRVSDLVGRGLANFEARVANSALPTKQALQAARQKLTNNHAELAAALAEAWRAWADARVAELRVAKIAVLDPFHREGVEVDRRTLNRLAAGVATPDDVELFVGKFDRVRQVLDSIEPDDALVTLLGRLDAPDGVVFADLSDDELALLRANTGVADQIVLRRRR